MLGIGSMKVRKSISLMIFQYLKSCKKTRPFFKRRPFFRKDLKQQILFTHVVYERSYVTVYFHWNDDVFFVQGFSVAGQENLQEVLTKRLVLCQFLCALSILRKGGYFLCKTFDLFTPFSIGLVYLLYRAFDHVCIHKPVTSRPANSER